jgi:hypothetical protein
LQRRAISVTNGAIAEVEERSPLEQGDALDPKPTSGLIDI